MSSSLEVNDEPAKGDTGDKGLEEQTVTRINSNMATEVIDIDTAYLTSSRSSKMYRSVLFQMIMFGAISFVGPAMSDAISNLGGGGLSSPYLSNLANALNYAS